MTFLHRAKIALSREELVLSAVEGRFCLLLARQK
jgi:hypothetical protein